jgi:hypothetical protein
MGWLASTAVFVNLVHLFSYSGGPSWGDAYESVISTYSISHGNFSCAYPGPGVFGHPQIPPVWPLFSGAFAALTRMGHSVPFPSTTEMGPHCSMAANSIYRWTTKSTVNFDVTQLAYLSWLVLMAGAIAFLRTTDRGRRRWEPTALLYLAAVPPVWMSIESFFHPQDLMAMGLALGGLACARRDLWIWAGVLLGLGVMTQQFDLLVAVPLLVLAPTEKRVRYGLSLIGVVVILAAPFVVVSSGSAFRAIALGSGNSTGYGGTVVNELHLHGTPLVVVSRVLPILGSVGLAWWALRRFGRRALEPLPLLSLVALCLGLRLLFEQNLAYTYYYMALTVILILLDVVRGKFRGSLLAWIALVTLAYDPGKADPFSNSWGAGFTQYLPIAIMGVGLVYVLFDTARGRVQPYLIAWFVLMVAAFATWPFTHAPIRAPWPLWIWQLILVPTGIALAIRPLVAYPREDPNARTGSVEQPVAIA